MRLLDCDWRTERRAENRFTDWRLRRDISIRRMARAGMRDHEIAPLVFLSEGSVQKITRGARTKKDATQ